MLNLIRAALLLALVYSGYWYAAGYGLRSSLDSWFDARRAQGWLAEHAGAETSGYPLRHVTLLQAPALADPGTGTAWRADWLMLDSPAVWPGRQTLRFPATPQRLGHLDQTLVIEAEDMRADLDLHPGLALEVDTLGLTAGDWRLTQEGVPLAEADTLVLAMRQGTAPANYGFELAAKGFAPGLTLRRLTRTAPDLPPSFETLEARATVQFDRPWDRSALEQGRPQPVAIDLTLARAQWGALSLQAAGKLTVDGEGFPSGTLTVKAENWREMLAMAQAAGAVPAQAVGPAERVLNLLAGLGGNPDALEVELGFANGWVTLGPLPLGPAPRLRLR